MGNVLEHAGSVAIDDADVVEEDLKWLSVKGSMLFNDDFLEEEYTSLPPYEGTEMLPVPGNDGSPGLSADADVGAVGGLHGQDAVRRMLQLLRPQQDLPSGTAGADTGNGEGTSVEDFPHLLGESYLRASTHSTATRMRSRLFQRIHVALMRQAFRTMRRMKAEAGGKGGAGALAASSAFALPPSSAEEGRGESDPAAILTSASMRMSLTLMGALRATVPGLFASMAQTLMDLFQASAPFALGQVGSSSAYLETLTQVREVAERVATVESGSSKDERTQAVALLLSLGVATGSVSDVVRVAMLLLERDAPALPPSASGPLEQLRNHSTPPKVSIPKPGTWTASFPARLDTEAEGTGGSTPSSARRGAGGSGGNGRKDGAAAAGGGCCNPATDGVYVYVWDADTKRVHKVGTGFHGTLAGNVYLSSKKILDDIRVFKGMEPAPPEEDEEHQEEDEGEGEAASPQVGTGFHGTLAGNVYLSSKKILDDIRVFKGMEPAPPEEDEEHQEEDEGEGEAASPQADVLNARPRQSGGDGGIVMSEAAAQRRRSLMGTGLNIGGGLGLGMSDSDDSEPDRLNGAMEGFEEFFEPVDPNGSNESGSFNTANLEVDGISGFGLGSMVPRSSMPSSSSSSMPSSSSSSSSSSSASSSDSSFTFSPFPDPAAIPLPRGTPPQPPVPSSRRGSATPPLPAAATGGVGVASPAPRGADTAQSPPERQRSGGGSSGGGVRLHRVPSPVRQVPASGQSPMTVPPTGTAARTPPDSRTRSRSSSPPRTIDDILGAMGTMRARESGARIGVAMAVGAGTVGSLAVGLGGGGGGDRGGGGGGDGGNGGGARGNGLLRFRALEFRAVLREVPESGCPEEGDGFGEGEGEEAMEEDDEGYILDCKVVHGFRWYRVRVTTRAVSTQTMNIVGWVPLKSVDDSDYGSLDSDEKAELDGEEFIEILDPTTGETIEPDSPRALNPPVWDEAREASAAAVQDFNEDGGGRRDSRASRGGGAAAGGGGEAGPAAVRPVWLALAGGKLFVREKASGALSADEIAVLRPSDLSLVEVVSLADLPIPGFPASPTEARQGKPEDGLEEKQEVDPEDGGVGEVAETEDVVEFAYADLGASVAECSSNSELSGGVLQNNLLVREESDRLPFPSGGSSPSDVAFSFAPSDRDRVLVVDLGLARRVRGAGVELFPSPGAEISIAMQSLLVETSLSGNTWTTLGLWTASEHEQEEEGTAEYSAKITAAEGVTNIARFVRYTLAPSAATPPPWCLLTRLSATGPSEEVPEGLCREEEEGDFPFPAMTTDSRHIILVCPAGSGQEGDDPSTAAAAATALGDGDSPRRLEMLFLDPEDGYRLVRTATLAWGMDETELHQNAVLCDGERLVMLTHKHSGVVKRTADTAVIAMRCRSGVFSRSGDEEALSTTHQDEDMEFDVRPTGSLAPTGLGYDRRNNVMWGWDSILKKLCRWRNDGLAPIFAPPLPSPPEDSRPSTLRYPRGVVPSEGEGTMSLDSAAPVKVSDTTERMAWARIMLGSSSPCHRVEGLEEAGLLDLHDPANSGEEGGDNAVLCARGHAALLLGYLERLGEPYGPPEEDVAEPRVRCELEAASGGKDDGNFSRLLVRGEDRSCKEPGMNVLVLTETLDAGGQVATTFATHESVHASNRLADYLNNVPQGRTVLIAVQEDSSGNLGNSAKRALLSMGAGTTEIAALGMHKRSSFAMIGRRGASPGSVPQVLRMPKKGCATVRQRLPAPKVPMCVDVSKETLDNLVTLILRHESVLLRQQPDVPSQHVASEVAASSSARERGGQTVTKEVDVDGGVGQAELDAAVVLSAVNILTNQMFQLLRGSTPAAALASFSPDKLGPLLSLLIAVIDQNRPEVGEQEEITQTLSTPHPSVRAPRKQSDEKGLGPKDTAAGVVSEATASAADIGTAVRRVSCTGSVGASALDHSGGDGNGSADAGGRRAVAVGSAGARHELLQRACLRLFVTGMDLFFPSCAQRYSLLARYLSKYLSDGLSPARETVLELLLRRMSDPGQLVEIVVRPNVSAKVNEPNPFVVTPPIAATGASTPKNEGVLSGKDDVAQAATAMVATPAPSANELQCLLLSVATAEGVSRIKALQHRSQEKNTGNRRDSGRRSVEDGTALTGGVGEAAVEMLGRLMNQLLSSADCVIMESDLEAFDMLCEEEIACFLKAMGLAPLPTNSTTANSASGDTNRNEAASNISSATDGTAVGLDSTHALATVTGTWLGRDVSAPSTLVVLVTALCRSCAALAAQAAATADAIGEGVVAGKGILSDEADRILQESPLGALLPMVASSLTLLAEKHGTKIQGRLSTMAREIVGVMKMVSKLLERVPKDRLSVAGVSKGVGTVNKSVVMESKHNYEALTNETLVLEIKGAARMVVTFDERSRTEDGYDYLVFWKDESKTESWHPRIPKLSGTGSSCNFPGFGGRDPLVIEAERCWIEWRTDGSNEDWGWKFTASAELKKVGSGGDGGGYWLLGLDRQLAGAGAALAGCLVISKPWGGKAEDDNAPWMEDDLLAGAVSPETAAAAAAAVGPSPTAAANPTTTLPSTSTSTVSPTAAGVPSAGRVPAGGGLPREVSVGDVGAAVPSLATNAPPSPELVLLQEVVDRLEGTGGSSLCKVMRAKVGEDQGSVEAVNRAVYATCAALIWHQGLGPEALALAEGRVATPSKALSKAWRFGQQMRQFFDYGDVRDAVNSQMELQRQQAVAMETSRRSSASASLDDPSPSTRPILTRGPSIYQGAEERVIAEVSERIVSRALFLLSLPSQATRVSIQEQSKRRWSILARLGGVGSMQRTSSHGNSPAEGLDLLEKWKEVVDEATAMRKLKSILVYRRKAADMRERAKENSVSERIMKFAQCPADVSQLEMVRQCRDQRAKLRAEGLRLTRALVAAAASPPAKAWLLSSHAESIRLTKREDRPGAHVHYLSSVEGCEPRAYLALARQFALLIECTLQVLKDCSRPKKGETPAHAAERRLLAVSSLQALALDYDLGDHEILKESILLEVLEPLLQSFNEAGGGETSDTNNTDEDANATDPSEPVERKANAAEPSEVSIADNEDNGGGDDSDDEEFFDTGSIGDDIAALEAELQEEEGLLLDEANGVGDGELASHLPGAREESVRKAAWCLFEVLLPRCVGLEGQGLETRLEEPTSFSHRLLAVLIRQVGRASGNVQRSNASLAIDGLFSDQTSSVRPVVDAPTTRGGGEDSDGRASATATSLPKETPLLLRGMRLRRDEPGRAAAHRDLSVRHSMSMWLRRDACPMDAKPGAWYSPPKVGDTVARGPKWPRGDMSDGGPGGLGTVTELTKSNMTARVEWDITGFNGTYKMGSMAEFPQNAEDDTAPASVDDLLVWEVIKVDPSVGGSVVMKGGVNNLTHDERDEPWSQFGLSLLGNATLMYYATAEEDQLFSVHSRTMLQPDVWTHVAVVQAKNRCRIYVDGEENGEASLPQHMLTPGGMVKDVLESQHPYANNVDKMWDVRVEGALSYTISFDIMTKTERNHDYVRFLKDATDTDGPFFGEERYSGGRNGSESNWPGTGGRPPLVINAPSFAVFFHTDQSNNDWGFKMSSLACVAAPEEADEEKSEASPANLNPFPVYLGQPPSYASSQRSASGYLWGASTYAESLTAEQVRSLACAPAPPEPSLMEEEACTDVLSLVQRCASSMDGVAGQGGGLSLEAGTSPLVSPQVLGPLLVILLQGSMKLRLAAARLCERLLPQAPLEMVQVQLSRAGFSSPLVPSPTPGNETRTAPLVRGLMLKAGETLSVWSRMAAAGSGVTNNVYPPGMSSKVSLTSGEEAFASMSAHVGLLRALLAKEGWSPPLADCLREACSNLPLMTKALEGAGACEIEGGEPERVAEVLCDPRLWMVHACLALLGGSFQGLHVGGRAMALMGDRDGATVERCTVLAMDWPRLHHLAAIEREKCATTSRTANKGVDFVPPAKDWDGLESLGDAVIVCLHSEPDTPRVLPRGRVSPDSAPLPPSFLSALESPPFNLQSPPRGGGKLSAAAEAAVATAREEGTPGLIPYVPQGLVKPLVEAFGVLSAADATDKRVRHKPSVVVSDEERILESSHPHARGVDDVYPLDFPGADSIQLFFDEDCRTEEGTAYIRIYKDDTKTVIWGESMYQGRDKDGNWPGLDGRPAVCVPASSCVIKFHSEDRNPDWGFRIVAKAKCKTFTLPPERPPLVGPSALSLLQACGAKALMSLVTSWPQFVPHAQPLIKSLAERALGKNSSQDDLKKMATPRATKVVVESKHPYSHNADRKETVRIEGAKKLVISFDDRSRTEQGCDFMVFYADEAMSKVYGDNKYTGGKDGHPSNWPGTGGRPPLEIPASHFFFRWRTDGSVNDWGWRMVVTPVMEKMDAASLPPPMLDSKLASLLRICRDCPKEQPPALGLENFEAEPAIQPLPDGSSVRVGEPSWPSSIHSPIVWDSFFEAQTAKTDLFAVSTADTPAVGMPKIPRCLRRYRLRVFVVNPRDAEEISLRAAPRTDSDEVSKVRINTQMLVVEERGDWMRVIPIVVPVQAALRRLEELWVRFDETLRRGKGGEMSSENDNEFFEKVTTAFRMSPAAAGKGDVDAMWALRRQGDMLYMVPREEASSHLVTLPDEGDVISLDKREAASTAGRASSGTEGAAFEVVDPPQGDEVGPASQGAFGIQAGAELTSESHRLWSALTETSHATATRFSRLALTRILAGSAESSYPGNNSGCSPLALDDYGGPHMFLTLLRATYSEARESESDVDIAALEVLKKKILGAVGQESSEEGEKIADMLMAFALHQLKTAVSLSKFLCPTKAVARIFETAHNYADNTDTYTKISIPGAKRIRVVFDERCSTEMGCDFVRIYKDAEHTAYWGEHKYNGPATSRGKIWAGVAGFPPLTIEANTIEVHFHSDASNNDWGVRMHAYGIMQEPTPEERAAYRELQEEVGDPETELACWLLEALAKESQSRYVKTLMHRFSTMETLARFLEAADNKAKIWVVRLISSLLQSACSPKADGDSLDAADWDDRLEAMFEPAGPVPVLLELAKKEAKAEEDKGISTRSPLLQALVQACVVADECDTKRGPGAVLRDGAEAVFPRWSQRPNVERSDDDRLVRSTSNAIDTAPLVATPGFVAPVGMGGRGVIRWHVKVLAVSESGPRSDLRLGVFQPNTSVGGPSWLLTWGCDGNLQMAGQGMPLPYGPKIKAGDMVTVEVDALKKEVRFYRNQALVGLAFGPDGSSARIEHDETPQFPPWRDGEALHVAVILGGKDNAVQIVPPPVPLCSTITSLSPSGDTTWWGARLEGGKLGAIGGEEWLEGVKESMELMSAVLKRELPATFVAKELLPSCQERAALTLESSHPLGASHTEETVTIKGATSLEVVFDVRTSMGPGDKISVFRESDQELKRVLQGLVGATESSFGSNNSAKGSKSSSGAFSSIAVGDSVVRGPAWNWGEDDGGPGGYGTVIDIRPWKGKPRSGVKVRWADTSFVGLYRWDHEGCFDVLIVAHGSTSTKPIVIKGDSLSIHVDPDSVSEPSSIQSSSSSASTPRLRLQDGASVSVKLKPSMGRDLLSGEFTLEAWFRLEASADGGLESRTYPLLSRSIIEGISQINIKAVSTTDRRRATVHVDMYQSNGLTTGISFSGGVLAPGRWGHVSFSIDAAGSAKLFVNGSEVASGSFQGSRMVLEGCDMVLGDSLDNVGTLNGHVYDLRLWSTALGAADVTMRLKALPEAGSPGLVVNFPFTEGEGAVLNNRGSFSEIAALPNLACTWTTSVEPPVEPTLSHWGWRCTVTPIYSFEGLSGLPEVEEELEALRGLYGSADVKHDQALVRYVNSFAEKKSYDAERLLRCSWDDMAPSEEDLVRDPLLRELFLWHRPPAASRGSIATKEGGGAAVQSPDGGVEETKGEDGVLAETKEDGKGVSGQAGDGARGEGKGAEGARVGVGPLFGKKKGGIAARFQVLQVMNRKLREALPYFDLAQLDCELSAAHLLSNCRGLIFRAIKEPVLLSALSGTAYADGGQFNLNLSRSKAAKHIHLGHTDTEGRWSVFGQAFRQMNTMHPRSLRTHSKLYNCVFMGERSQDAGGPYRESWSMYAQELQSSALPLLIRTPNGVHAAGMGRDRYVPNPGATSLDQVEMFVFLGKIMGHAMRSKEYIGLNLSVVVWKALVGQEVQLSDLENVDVLLTRSMQDIRTIDQKGVTRTLFSDIVMENFTAVSLDNREVELKPGGKNISVTWDNRFEYADLMEKQRLSECCSMVKHIRKGLAMVVPLTVLGMFNWDEVETMVCGKPEVDVDLLEAIAEYSGCRKEQPHIKFFWQALREFTPQERSMLIKFTWGRTRLPLTAEGFSQRFKLQNFARSPADDYLPVAHTCFFSLELPAYSSLEVMKERLLFAAFNCSAIDGDDNFAGMNAAALGWDWDEEEDAGGEGDAQA